jgi:hypothetical protein
MLDMERLFAHLQYIKDNPPAGTLIKAYFEAKAGNTSTTSHTPMHYEKPKFKTEAERKNYERRELNRLCSDFGVNINKLQKKPKRKLRKI